MKRIKTYIIHFGKLKDRKVKLEEELKRYSFLKPNWIIQEGYYSDELINKYYEWDRKEWKRKAIISNRPIVPYPLCKSQKHVLINHQLAREKIAKGRDDYALIIEDDVVFCEGFEEKFKQAINLLKKDKWDLCFLEYVVKRIEFPKEIKLTDNYGKEDCYCAGAYLIKKTACQKMINLNEKITLPNDDEQKYRCNLLGLRVLHIIPPLIEQTGDSESSGQHQRDKQGVKKFIYWRLLIYKRFPFISRIMKPLETKIKKIILKM